MMVGTLLTEDVRDACCRIKLRIAVEFHSFSTSISQFRVKYSIRLKTKDISYSA